MAAQLLTLEAALIVQAAVLLALTLVIAIVIQRLYLHPLSKYPGPWLNAISEIPEALQLITGRQHAYHRKLHDRYGSVVRVSPNELIFSGPKAWDDIYGNKPGKGDMEKSPLVAGGLPQGQQARSLTLANWDDHVRQRKGFAYPFSNSALLQQEPLVQGWVDKLITLLGEYADKGKPANIVAWFTYTTFDIIGDLCFDEPFGCLEAANDTEWSRNIVHIGTAGAYEQAARRVAGVGTWLQGQLSKWFIPELYRKWRMVHFANSMEKTRRRIAAKDKDHKDFIYYILKNNESKSLLSEMEIIMNSALFIGAGSDTTAIALSAWLYLVLTNESTYRKLVTEIRGAFTSHSDITWNAVKDLPYLGACISETLRIVPPAPGNFCRITPPEGGMIDGNWVAGNTTVSVSAWTASHSPSNFTKPLTFAPERWLDTEREKYPVHVKEASQAFSYGPRGCIGKNLSYIEQRLMISHLLWHYDFELAEEMKERNNAWTPEDDMKHMKSYLVWEKPDMWVKLRRVVR